MNMHHRQHPSTVHNGIAPISPGRSRKEQHFWDYAQRVFPALLLLSFVSIVLYAFRLWPFSIPAESPLPLMLKRPEDKVLISLYENMTSEFVNKGLDLEVVRAAQPWFHNVQPNNKPAVPRNYTQFEPALPYYGARLIVIPLDLDGGLVSTLEKIAQQVVAMLPASVKVFSNPPRNYHCTVFHTSHPADPRPNPMQRFGGVDFGTAPSKRRDSSVEEIVMEKQIVHTVVSHSKPPLLQLERVMLAPSGNLIVTWIDPYGGMAALRRELLRAFSGATTKQARIVHTTLTRIISDVQLGNDTRTQIAQACASWTSSLRGRTFNPAYVWYVREQQFSVIDGEQIRMDLAALPRPLGG